MHNVDIFNQTPPNLVFPEPIFTVRATGKDLAALRHKPYHGTAETPLGLLP